MYYFRIQALKSCDFRAGAAKVYFVYYLCDECSENSPAKVPRWGPRKLFFSREDGGFRNKEFQTTVTCLLSQRFTYPLTKLSPTTCLVACLLSQGITYPLTKPMPLFNGSSTENSHIFPHRPCLLSKALPQITHISSHTDHALFQRLFHRKFTHPLTEHMSFYMTSFNETKAAYVKELPRKVNPV